MQLTLYPNSLLQAEHWNKNTALTNVLFLKYDIKYNLTVSRLIGANIANSSINIWTLWIQNQNHDYANQKLKLSK